MGNFLYNIGLSLLDIGIKRLFLGAGLGLVSYTTLKTIFDTLINNALQSMNSGLDLALSFLGLSGVDTALSIVISAMLIRVTILSAQLHIIKN